MADATTERLFQELTPHIKLLIQEALKGKLNTNFAKCKLEDMPNWTWSVRILNVFNNVGIETIEDLVGRSEAELLKFRNLGKKSIKEIHDFCYAFNLPAPRN